MAAESRFGARNYAPLQVVLAEGRGATVTDTSGRHYVDCLAAYSAVNQGHCHPRIVAALETQARTLTLTSRAFYNDKLGAYERFACELFGYDRLLPMNTGVEAVETAVKLARRWAYDVKGVTPGGARVVFAAGNFWGRSIAAVSSSTDPASYGGFGPLLPGFDVVPYDDLAALEAALAHPCSAAFVVEPIQGEAGVVVPSDDYLAGAKALCEKHGALLVADEVQTGLGRTGAMLASGAAGVRPDVLVLGKALSGGVYPVSAVLANDEVMLTVGPGEHGSTYGGNPLACAVAEEALRVLIDEDLAGNAAERGRQLRAALIDGAVPGRLVCQVRGKGLLTGVVLRTDDAPATAYDVCVELARRGVLAKPTGRRNNVIRLAPPLCITEEQTRFAADALVGALDALSKQQ